MGYFDDGQCLERHLEKYISATLKLVAWVHNYAEYKKTIGILGDEEEAVEA